MSIEEILKLGEMGFTKEDILKLSAVKPEEKKPEEKKPEEKKPEEKKPEEKPEEKKLEEKKDEPDPLESVKKQMENMAASIAAISKVIVTPNLDSVQPLGIDDIINKFFKED